MLFLCSFLAHVFCSPRISIGLTSPAPVDRYDMKPEKNIVSGQWYDVWALLSRRAIKRNRLFKVLVGLKHDC